MITIHTIVCNEDRFVKASLMSVLASPDVIRALVWDAGSMDKTVQEIRSIKDSRIELRELGKLDRKRLVNFRSEQLRLTKTPWFMLVDGDEIWPKKNLTKLILTMQQCSNVTIAMVNCTRNVAGDLHHYLPDSEGHYKIGSWTGHLNIRAIRNVKGLTVKGEYPNERYELDGKKIQDYPECKKVRPWNSSRSDLARCLQFVDTWYLHTTHLRRSSSLFAELTTIDRLKKRKWIPMQIRKMKVMKLDEFPETLRNRDLR